MQAIQVQTLNDTQATLRMILKEEEISPELKEAYQFVIGHIKTLTPVCQNL